MGYFKKWWLAEKNEIEPIPEFKASGWKYGKLEVKPVENKEYSMQIRTTTAFLQFKFLSPYENTHEIMGQMFGPVLNSGDTFFMLSGGFAFGDKKKYDDRAIVLRMADIIDINIVKIEQEEDENND